MTRAHAAGVRMPYAAAPGRVRRWVDGRLGGRVVELVDCVGGMSPGPATRVRSTTGLRAFVKACGPELNPDTPDLLRTEARVLASLPAHPSLPRLLDLYDDGAWVALLVEDLDGSLPALPWRRPDLDRVAAALADARPALDTAEVAGIEKVRDSSPLLADRWRLLEPHLDRVDPWWRTHHDTLASHAARALVAVDGDVLLHWDVRSDNVVLTTDRTVLVDWGQCRRGAQRDLRALGRGAAPLPRRRTRRGPPLSRAPREGRVPRARVSGPSTASAGNPHTAFMTRDASGSTIEA